MDGFTLKATLVIGLLLMIGLLWLVWKFFARLLKHVIILIVICVAGSAFYYYRSLPPPPPPYVGKHAYMKENGEYIGVVESESIDSRRGPVWIIRPVGGYPTRYAKARVTLKDKMELKTDQTPQPSPQTIPASDKADKNANKVDKKKN